MLLRNRSRAVTKPGLKADHTSQPSPNKQNRPTHVIPSFFGSQKFREVSSKCVSGCGKDTFRSPTSILEGRVVHKSPLGLGKIPFWHQSQAIPSPNTTHSNKGVGLALQDSLQIQQVHSDKGNNVLFGTQVGVGVKIPIPPSKVSPFDECHSHPPCAADFGLKSTHSTGVVCWSELELCEEYTCVRSHGPNPRTTHIFDDCILNVIDNTYFSSPSPTSSFSSSSSFPCDSHYDDFLTFCYTCKMRLDHTRDIFIYR